ncbi:MAG: hypothetical protein ACRBFS_04740 [Aureispira sp.]
MNWLLYSNIFIAFCAVAMTAQTLFLLGKELMTSPALLGLVFFSTWFIYALHRLVSWRKLDARLDIQRFQIIGAYQRHIKFYAGFSALLAAFCFFYLERATQLALLLPALLSLGYVLPFIGRQRLRLRDLHFIKIFLIAGVWAYVTVVLPLLETFSYGIGEYGNPAVSNTTLSIILLLVERALFIFIITLPFDLRDWKLDAYHSVKTIPTLLGPERTIYLGVFLLLLWGVLIMGVYIWPLPLGYSISGLWTGVLLWRTLDRDGNENTTQVVEHDYYYTGLIDGTMLVQALLIIGMGAYFLL